MLQSLLTLRPVTSPSQLRQRWEAGLSSHSMASALPQERPRTQPLGHPGACRSKAWPACGSSHQLDGDPGSWPRIVCSILLGYLRTFGLTSKYHPGVCVQKLGVIKYTLTGRTSIPAGGKKQKQTVLLGRKMMGKTVQDAPRVLSQRPPRTALTC